jgi:hypothetical protein
MRNVINCAALADTPAWPSSGELLFPRYAGGTGICGCRADEIPIPSRNQRMNTTKRAAPTTVPIDIRFLLSQKEIAIESHQD